MKELVGFGFMSKVETDFFCQNLIEKLIPAVLSSTIGERKTLVLSFLNNDNLLAKKPLMYGENIIASLAAKMPTPAPQTTSANQCRLLKILPKLVATAKV